VLAFQAGVCGTLVVRGFSQIARYIVKVVLEAGVPISLYVRELIPAERLARNNADG
jgi:hypothetical protein